MKIKSFLYLEFTIIVFLVLTPFSSVGAVVSPGDTTYYVDFDGGSDANDGLTTGTPFKHAPGDANATSNADVDLAPGDTVMFRGGVTYKGKITVNGDGTSSKRIAYKGDGWGGEKAIIDGSEQITGFTQCASAADCGNNANFANIYKATIPSIPTHLNEKPEITLNIFQDDEIIIPAQYPESIKRTYQSTNSYLAVPKTAVTNTTLTDTRLASLGGSSLVGSYIYIWHIPNKISFVKITGYNAVTNTITFPAVTVYTDRDTLYALANNVGSSIFHRPGSYYFNPTPNGGGTYDVYVWPLNGVNLSASGEVTYSTQGFGINMAGKDYITVEGLIVKKQSGDTLNEGHAVYSVASGRAQYAHIHDNEFSQQLSLGGAQTRVLFADHVRVYNNYVHSGAGSMRGIQTDDGIDHEVYNNTVRDTPSTGIKFQEVDGGKIYNNTISGTDSPHGNGISVYLNSNNIEIYNNKVWDSNIAMTISRASNLLIHNNLFDGSEKTTYVFSDWGSNPGTHRFYNNTVVGSSADCSVAFSQKSTVNWEVKNNILEGAPGSVHPSNWDFKNNVYTGLCWSQGDSGGWTLKSGEVEADATDVFNNPGTTDYSLKAGSPAIDSGLDFSSLYSTDFFGTALPQGSAFDIGGIEYFVGGGDITPPALSNGSPSGVLPNGTTSTTISVTTNENATCRYSVLPGRAYSSMSVFDTTGGTSHSHSVSGLQDSYSYSYYIKCQDGSSNTNQFDYTVSFNVGNDITPPFVTQAIIDQITDTTARIRWFTNEPADSQVQYGLEQESYEFSSTLNTTLATSHQVILTGLTPETTYYLQVLSRDAAGNLRDGNEQQLITLAAGTSTPPDTPRTELRVGPVRVKSFDDAFRLVRNMKTQVVGEEVTISGKAEEFASGEVEIKAEGKTLGRAPIAPNGDFRKNVSFEDSGKVELRLIYTKDTDRTSRRYTLRVDDEDPQFEKIPGVLNKRPGARVYWNATDNIEIDEYKYTFRGKKIKTKKEEFNLPKNTPPGTYDLTIRAYDTAGNSEKIQTKVRVR